MHQHYDDILSRIPEPPKWFDLTGVPRYCDFAPNEIANIYAKECALMEISCQQCRTKFLVAIDTRLAKSGEQADATFADLIRSGRIHYGDPPNVRCCAGGPVMNSIPIRILEYWHRDERLHWRRDQSLEIEITERG